MSDALDAEVANALRAMAPDDGIDVLVYPQSFPAKALRQFLDERAATADVRHNALHFAGCIALHAPKHVVLEVAARADVVRVAVNPTFRAGG